MRGREDSTLCTNCEQELADDALFCPNCGTPRSREPEGDPLLGTVVGERFLLLERLGHGGSGTIYRAEHVTLRRKVAIKVLHHELSRDEMAMERFRREATTVSALDNEHIVAIHDFGRTDDGRLYLAMELLEGETLEELLRRERQLSVARAVDVLLQLGEALAEAHAMGYVHRDLRPRNIWLTARRGKSNFVKLLDFGLAKLVAHEGFAASTSLGMTFGDPKYMSPEQARGEVLDRRADIYSLGCIAYEMLVGEPPFASGKAFDIITRQLDSMPPAPRERRGDVPPWLSSAIMHMLAKRPDDRFITVYRLIETLREGMAGTPAAPAASTPAASTASTPAASTPAMGTPAASTPAASTASTPALGVPVSAARRRPITLPAGQSPSQSRTPQARGQAAGQAAGQVGDPIDGPIAGEPEDQVHGQKGDQPSGLAKAPADALPEAHADARPEAPAEAQPNVPADEQPEAPAEAQPKAPAEARAEAPPDDLADDLSGDRSGDLADGLEGDWFADADGALDESGRQRLDDARFLFDEDETMQVGARRPMGKILLIGGGVLGLVLLTALLWAASGSSSDTEPAAAEQGDAAAATAAKGSAAEVLAALDQPADAAAGDAAEPADAEPADAGVAPADAAPADAPGSGRSSGSGTATKPDPAPARGAREDEPRPRAGGSGKDRRTSGAERGTGQGHDTLADPWPTAKPSGETARQAEFFAKLGQQALRSGNIPGAAANFKKARELDSRNADAIIGQGEIALRQGSYANAIARLKQGARQRPRSAHVHTLLGEAYLGAGQRSQAAASFKRALALEPGNTRAREGYAEATGTSGGY